MTEYPKLKDNIAETTAEGYRTLIRIDNNVLIGGERDAMVFNACHTQFSTALRERASVEKLLDIIYSNGGCIESESKLANDLSNHILNGLEGK